MSATDQPADSNTQPPEGRGYPFPSLVGDLRLTLAPNEVATRFAVSEQHILDLIANGCLETLQEPNTREYWVTVASLKAFIGKRLSAPAPEAFWGKQKYLALKFTHHEMAIYRGETWNYVPFPDMPEVMDFVPTRLKLNSDVALTDEQIQGRFGWDAERLFAMFLTRQWVGIVDFRLSASAVPLLRVPVEAYYYWIRMLILVGPITAQEFLSKELADSMYAELGEFIQARRSSSEPANN